MTGIEPVLITALRDWNAFDKFHYIIWTPGVLPNPRPSYSKSEAKPS